MLEFGMKPPISYNTFLERSKEQLIPVDMAIIERASIGPYEDINDNSPVLREWKRFDTLLRNELVRSRAAKKHKDPSQYIRGGFSQDPFIAPFSHWAINQDSPLEAELYLDKIRWERLEELKGLHYFDIEYLVTYCLQLQILERWHRINSGDGMQVLERLINI